MVRTGSRPRIAVVQRSKDDRWVLPRGKLKLNERAIVGAQREAFEETGHRVRVRKFLGAITYRAQGKPKLVQFWHMQAAAHPSRELMRDIAAVAWLPLPAAVRRLSYPIEKLFLRSVGETLVRRKRRAPSKPRVKAKHGLNSKAKSKRTTRR